MILYILFYAVSAIEKELFWVYLIYQIIIIIVIINIIFIITWIVIFQVDSFQFFSLFQLLAVKLLVWLSRPEPNNWVLLSEMSNVLISRKTIIDITINLFEKFQKVSRKSFNFFTRIDLSELKPSIKFDIQV
jgi:hypothetical protein